MSLPQEKRLLKIETPLGPDVLALIAIEGTETISEGFRYMLDMFSEEPDIAFEDIVGQRVTVSMPMSNGETRFINGFVASFEHGHRSDQKTKGLARHTFYHAEIVPWSWLLSRMINNRIFQEKDVKEIVQQVFDDRGNFDYEWKLSGRYKKRTYCVQYNETDLNFVSRLLEEEGIHTFFRHEQGIHTMVLADSPGENQPCPCHDSARFRADRTEIMEEDFISQLTCKRRITPNKYTLSDYNFESPNTSLLVETDTNQQSNPGGGQREIYSYPGKYGEYNDGENYGRLRMETEEVGITTITGESQCRGFSCGHRFKLEDFNREELNNKDYLLVSVGHQARQGWEELGDRQEDHYSNRFTCIPHEIPFRPKCISPQPKIQGVQTAIVVGPSGEEIYPDEYGRVKVQFHWDREGQKDDKSSCWIRVGQAWAGGGWGAMYIPRIGQEVIVEFVEGDPDRPIITGSVYHGNNKPPYNLPSEKTKSYIMSDSSKGHEGSNEIRFEDKKGEEEVFLHGQKDWTIAIDNDKNQTVGHDETLSVGNNRSLSVGVNKSESVGSNMNQTIGQAKAESIGAAKALTIGAAYQVTVGAAMNETVGAAKAEEIGGAKSVNVGVNSVENIGKNKSVDAGKNISETAGKDVTITAGGKMALVSEDDFLIKGNKNGVIEIKDQLTIKIGKATITMKKNGDVMISGKKLNLKATGDVNIKGSKVKEN